VPFKCPTRKLGAEEIDEVVLDGSMSCCARNPGSQDRGEKNAIFWVEIRRSGRDVLQEAGGEWLVCICEEEKITQDQARRREVEARED